MEKISKKNLEILLANYIGMGIETRSSERKGSIYWRELLTELNVEEKKVYMNIRYIYVTEYSMTYGEEDKDLEYIEFTLGSNTDISRQGLEKIAKYTHVDINNLYFVISVLKELQ